MTVLELIEKLESFKHLDSPVICRNSSTETYDSLEDVEFDEDMQVVFIETEE